MAQKKLGRGENNGKKKKEVRKGNAGNRENRIRRREKFAQKVGAREIPLPPALSSPSSSLVQLCEHSCQQTSLSKILIPKSF